MYLYLLDNYNKWKSWHFEINIVYFLVLLDVILVPFEAKIFFNKFRIKAIFTALSLIDPFIHPSVHQMKS